MSFTTELIIAYKNKTNGLVKRKNQTTQTYYLLFFYSITTEDLFLKPDEAVTLCSGALTEVAKHRNGVSLARSEAMNYFIYNHKPCIEKRTFKLKHK